MKHFQLFVITWMITIITSCACIAKEEISFAAGTVNLENGISFIPMRPIDGNAKLTETEGKYSLKTDIKSQNPYIYFDINRKRLLEYGYQPYHILMEIEYLDNGTNSMAIQYDSMGYTIAAHHKEINWERANSNKWIKKSIEIKDAQFGNGQQGVSDFRIAGAVDDIFISSIKITCIGASDKNSRVTLPEQKAIGKKWLTVDVKQPVIITPMYLSEPEQIALDRLAVRFEYLSAPKPIIIKSFPDDSKLKKNNTYFVIGKTNRYEYKDDISELTDLTESVEKKDIQDQSYLLAKRKIGSSNVIYALGAGDMGSVFAMSHLETHLWSDNNILKIHLEKNNMLESPDFKQRELYINIGYGLTRNRITPDTWTLDDWKDYIDKLVLARYNSWSFYLWGDSEFAYPDSYLNKEKNIYVHKTIQEAIKYSHKRGLKVGYHLAPTMIPDDILTKHPELKSVLEYPASGIVCPSKPASWDLIIPVYENQIEWFKECDFFPIWFYDCAGCFCDICKVPDQQLKTLVMQVREMDKIIQKKNPSAEIQVVTWAIWRYERMHKYYIRDRFINEIEELFEGRKDKLIISDGIYIDNGCEPLFPLANKLNIETKSFIYQTNIEDGQPFASPMTRYFEKWVPASKKAGTNQIHLMRMETLAKYPQDFTGGYLFWNHKAKGNDAVRLYSLYATGNSESALLLNKAMLNIDDFSWYGYQGGAADTNRGEMIYNDIKSAIDLLSAERQKDLDWLLQTGEGYKVLGKAAEQKANEDLDGIEISIQDFKKALLDSDDFKAQVDTDVWLNLSRNFVNYYYLGWENNHF